ncbi:DASH complex subunit dam1 [Zygosaccharomyces mellis]|uniref:DASH complex subunit DAM1 n=1 Tax=Zygosaccharomyces mellis TaxID=42258 RepID=A0A4C2E5F8_9SACH|nr:DASH complex subunit dam1 [Zygosaccharomyces mellis]
MSQERHKPIRRSATEYRLSITSNPESRRSSLGGTIDGGSGSSIKNNRSGGGAGTIDDGESIVQEFILPQIREFSDSMITLDANFTQLNFIHESLVDLNESLGALLYGLMCNSWCVDFPNITHDIEEELQTTKRLEAIKKERKSLLDQLNAYRNKPKNDDLQEQPKLSSKVLPQAPPSQTQRNPPVFAPPPSRLPQRTFGPIEHDSEDENASEASFVSNPIINGLPRQEISKPRANKANRLRRKSILHTIRHSISSTDLENNDFGPSRSTQGSRMSLGGGATRLINNNFSQSLPSSRRPVGSRNGETSQLQQKRKTFGERPPFR